MSSSLITIIFSLFLLTMGALRSSDTLTELLTGSFVGASMPISISKSLSLSLLILATSPVKSYV